MNVLSFKLLAIEGVYFVWADKGQFSVMFLGLQVEK